MPDTVSSLVDRCTARQLKELLAFAASPAETAPEWLAEIGDRQRLESLLTEMCSGTDHSGIALLEAVCSPNTPVDVLVAVKDVAKRLAAAAQSKPQGAAATLLYHLSVASAFGHHGQNISAKNFVDRLALYEELATELSDEELASVFDQAVERLVLGRS
jgi:hypothetical protein